MDNQKTKKWIVILLLMMFVLTAMVWGVAIVLVAGQQNVKPEIATNDSTQEKEFKADVIPKYERVETEKVNYIGYRRYVTKVLIEEEVSKEQLIEISTRLVDEMIQERGTFQGLLIHYYSHIELINEIATLGTYTYAPNGRWKDAGEGKSDFSNFLGDTTQLREKNWEDKPTDQEIKMYQDYDDFELRDEGLKFLATKYNISEDEASNHMTKVNRWIYE